MSDMTNIESFERFSEGLKKAASRSRELAVAQKDDQWNKVAFMLDSLCSKGNDIFRGRAIPRQEALKMADNIEERLKERARD